MTFEELSRFELKRGNHERPEEGLCVLEAVAWFEGEPHGDHPRCVCPVIGHFCRSFNDHLDCRRQELVAYIPRLVNTISTKDVFRERMEFLATEYLAVGGSEQLAKRVKRGFENTRLPVYATSFALALLCDAITMKRPASYSFKILDRLLSMGAPTADFATGVSRPAGDLEAMLAS